MDPTYCRYGQISSSNGERRVSDVYYFQPHKFLILVQQMFYGLRFDFSTKEFLDGFLLLLQSAES